jgi:hypothetical protein
MKKGKLTFKIIKNSFSEIETGSWLLAEKVKALHSHVTYKHTHTIYWS